MARRQTDGAFVAGAWDAARLNRTSRRYTSPSVVPAQCCERLGGASCSESRVAPVDSSDRRALLLLGSTALASSILSIPASALANVGGKDRCNALTDLSCGSDGAVLGDDIAVLSPPEFPPSALITSTVFLDINSGGSPLGRVVLSLFGESSPASAATFERLCTQLSGPSYASSQVFQIAKDDAIYMGRLARGAAIRQERYIDYTGYVRTLNLNAADDDKNDDGDNGWTHDGAGLLSMKRGGGSYEFAITTGEGKKADLDKTNIVVGKVVEGMDIIAKLNRLPVNKKTSYKDAFISAGKLIKDKRATAAEDDINKPLQKVVVRKCGKI